LLFITICQCIGCFQRNALSGFVFLLFTNSASVLNIERNKSIACLSVPYELLTQMLKGAENSYEFDLNVGAAPWYKINGGLIFRFKW